MKILRRLSTTRLIATCVGILALAGAGAAIALAATGGGRKPPARPLAVAIHAALGAPAVPGVSARIAFTNRLIDKASLDGGGDPILSGATGRLWLSRDGRLRLELQSSSGDAQVLVDHNRFSVLDASSHTVYEGTLPRDASRREHAPTRESVPTIARIQSELARLMQRVDLSGAIPSSIAGRPAYTVQISPKHAGGLLGSAKLAWDAARGVPLRASIYAQGDSSPVLELTATDVTYGPVPASTFAVSAPPGTKVVRVHTPASRAGAHPGVRRRRSVTGPAAVRAALPFRLSAPATLVGLPRHGVRLLSWGGTPAALVTYGRNLGGIAVIERRASASSDATAHRGGGSRDTRLPTVSIDGATGTELGTALGTVVQFRRGGIAYTVLGSVPPSAAEAAARGL